MFHLLPLHKRIRSLLDDNTLIFAFCSTVTAMRFILGFDRRVYVIILRDGSVGVVSRRFVIEWTLSVVLVDLQIRFELHVLLVIFL